MKRTPGSDRQFRLDFADETTTRELTADALPPDWASCLPHGLADIPLAKVAAERARGITVYPPAGQVFRALYLVPPSAVRAVILGQDPYHEPGQAMGLAFAVPNGCKLPPSLKNILKEYAEDWKQPPPAQPDLTKWARQGVLLLNTLLSVREHAAFSHRDFGWETVTDAILKAVSLQPHRVVFILWGAPAQAKRPLIDETRHAVLAAPHPSPLSAYRGFFGSKPFTTANRLLAEAGRPPIDWTL
jgi:uracil-DNA glycosylase